VIPTCTNSNSKLGKNLVSRTHAYMKCHKTEGNIYINISFVAKGSKSQLESSNILNRMPKLVEALSITKCLNKGMSKIPVA